jgi:cbb3-type cytochrome oxidase maturation protein
VESLYILIPIAVIFVAIAIAIYLWAVDNEQFKDLDKEAHSILFDKDPDKHTEQSRKRTDEQP